MLRRARTDLGIFELLLDIPDGSLTHFTAKSTADQFRPDFTCSSDCSGDTCKLTDLVHSHITDTARNGQVVESDVEISSLEGRRRGRRGRGGREGCGGVEECRLVFSHEGLYSSSQERQESIESALKSKFRTKSLPVVLILNCSCEDFLPLEQMTEIDI
jgi:hypothetical protein